MGNGSWQSSDNFVVKMLDQAFGKSIDLVIHPRNLTHPHTHTHTITRERFMLGSECLDVPTAAAISTTTKTTTTMNGI